jgi:ParB family chromosome partitioning protein
MNILIDKITPDPEQPRKAFDEEALTELSVSIMNHGVLMPILVRQDGDQFIIVAGERRWRASKMAGMTEIPVTVMIGESADFAEASIIENIQRQDLSPIEEAYAYKRLLDIYGNVNKVADRVGKSRPTVSNVLRLLKLPATAQQALAERKMTVGQGLMILGAPETMQSGLSKIALERDLSPAGIRAIYKPTEASHENYTPVESKEIDMAAAEKEVLRKVNGKATRFAEAVCPNCAFEFMVDG